VSSNPLNPPEGGLEGKQFGANALNFEFVFYNLNKAFIFAAPKGKAFLKGLN